MALSERELMELEARIAGGGGLPLGGSEDERRQLQERMIHTLNAGLQKGESSRAAKQCVALLTHVSGAEEGRAFALNVITSVNDNFEQVYERAQVDGDGDGLHVHVLVVLLDVLQDQFTGRQLWELCSENMERCLAIIAAFFSGAYVKQAARVEAVLRVLFQLTVADTYLDCGLEQVSTLKELQKLTGELSSHNNSLIRGIVESPVIQGAVQALKGPVELVCQDHASGRDIWEPSAHILVHDSLENLFNCLHNLLLYSTESSTKLRKHITQTTLVQDLLLPYSSVLVKAWAAAPHPHKKLGKQLRMALHTCIILTCKIAVYRQDFLAGTLARDAIGACGGDVEVVHLLSRLCCNLDFVQSVRQSAKMKEKWDELQKAFLEVLQAFDETSRAKLRRRFEREDPALPLTRNNDTFKWFRDRIERAADGDAQAPIPAADAGAPMPSTGSATQDVQGKLRRSARGKGARGGRNRNKKKRAFGWRGAVAQQLAEEMGDRKPEGGKEEKRDVLSKWGKPPGEELGSKAPQSEDPPASEQDQDQGDDASDSDDSDLDLEEMSAEISRLRQRLGAVEETASRSLASFGGNRNEAEDS